MIKHYMNEMLFEGKKVVFLVPSVPLVDQQKTFISDNTALRVKSFCGADGVDDWNLKNWNNAIDSAEVLVMIHQVFLDAMNGGYINLTDVCLLILDECHHAVGDSPYAQIFRYHYDPLKKKTPQKLPHIL